jgi:hypothetical protein
MARLVPGIDYSAEAITVRDSYVGASLRQRLHIVRLRLEDNHFGPNRLVTTVSAVEALARSIAINCKAKSKADKQVIYSRYKYEKPEDLIIKCLKNYNISNPKEFFDQDNWELFGYAVEFRNLLVHECTYLGLDKFPSLIAACEEILESLVKLANISETQAKL